MQEENNTRRKEMQRNVPTMSQPQRQEPDQPGKPKRGGDAR